MAKKKAEEPDDEVEEQEPVPEDWKKQAKEMRKKLTFGNVITLFNKTPPLEGPKSAYCPHFMELKHAYGCWYSCAWCYLMGTTGRWMGEQDFRDPRRPNLVKTSWTPNIKDKDEIAKRIEQALSTIEKPMMFNSGEVSDSLVDPVMMLTTIIPIFEKYRDKGHKLLILTKTDNVDMYRKAVKYHGPEFMVISHSINAEWVSDTFETGAPNPLRRLAANRAAAEIGYDTRLRLDPMVPVPNWKVGYRKIIQEITRIAPRAKVITLGSLRGLQSTINVGRKLGMDMRWTEYLTDSSSWGKKMTKEQRVEMYSFAINEFNRLHFNGDITLCKETVEVWDALRANGTMEHYPGEKLCNCVMEPTGRPDIYSCPDATPAPAE